MNNSCIKIMCYHIGEEGARMFVKVAATEGHRLELSVVNCEYSMSSADLKFKSNGYNSI